MRAARIIYRYLTALFLADVLLQDRAAKTLTGLGRDEHSYLIPSFVAQSLGVPSR